MKDPEEAFRRAGAKAWNEVVRAAASAVADLLHKDPESLHLLLAGAGSQTRRRVASPHLIKLLGGPREAIEAYMAGRLEGLAEHDVAAAATHAVVMMVLARHRLAALEVSE